MHLLRYKHRSQEVLVADEGKDTQTDLVRPRAMAQGGNHGGPTQRAVPPRRAKGGLCRSAALASPGDTP